MRLKIKAGPHPRLFCPVEVEYDRDLPTSYRLVDEKTGMCFPSQFEKKGESKKIVFVIPFLAEGEERSFILEDVRSKEVVETKVRDYVIDVLVSGEPLASYHIHPSLPRPFLYPLFGPKGIPVTRNYPMADVEGESKDHKHHRSLWVAYGDVNGVDIWSEEEGHGRQVHREFKEICGGVVRGRFVEVLDWVDSKGKKVLEEEREIIFYNMDYPLRMIDFRITFIATEGDVVFGDTKEGGILSLRVASEIEGIRGGRLENAFGGIGEREIWGKRAPWCDYSGSLRGEIIGIAILDHPSNLRHPTYWHIRDYGLFTANPFGVSYFTGNPENRGDYKLSKGNKLEFRYRVIIHRGNAREAKIKEHFINYAYPPEVEIEND